MSEEHSPNLALLRAEREPDTDLTRPPRRGIRHHSVDADEPSTSAMDAAMPSITSAKDVRVIDASYISCIVSTSVRGTLALTDDRRCLIASINAWLPARHDFERRQAQVDVSSLSPRLIVWHEASGCGGRCVSCQIGRFRGDRVDAALIASPSVRAHLHNTAINDHIRWSQWLVAVDSDDERSWRNARETVGRCDRRDGDHVVLRWPDHARAGHALKHRSRRVDLERQRFDRFGMAQRVHRPVLQRVISITGHSKRTGVGGPITRGIQAVFNSIEIAVLVTGIQGHQWIPVPAVYRAR
jgi:hypothetical protein